MGLRKTRTGSHTSASATPVVTYTVTVAHEPDAECDSCAQPRPMLIEQEGGAWICEVCAGTSNNNGFLWAAAINGIYNAIGDGI